MLPIRVLLTSLLVLCSTVRGWAKDEVDVSVAMEVHRLNNGLRVILLPDPSSRVISYQTWVRVGSVDELPGKTGIAHLFEHLMFKGTPKFAAREFFQRLETRGATVNAYTARDYTVFYEDFIPPLLPTAIELESDRLANLRIEAEKLEIEKQVVMEELELREKNSPSGKMQESLWGLAYTRHPYQNPVIGQPWDILHLTAKDLNDFFARYYVASNVTLVISGDIQPKTLLEKITAAYGKLPERPVPSRSVTAEPSQGAERRLRMKDHVAGTSFMQGHHVSSAFDQDSYALDVLASILFDGEASRAHRRMVEEEDLLLLMSGTAYTPTYPGLFTISGYLQQGAQLSKVEASLERLISEVQTKGVQESEVKAAVRKLTVDMVEGIRSPFGLGQLVGTSQMVLGEAERFKSDLQKYLLVTPEAVKKVALKYFTPDNRTFIYTTPEGAKK